MRYDVPAKRSLDPKMTYNAKGSPNRLLRCNVPVKGSADDKDDLWFPGQYRPGIGVRRSIEKVLWYQDYFYCQGQSQPATQVQRSSERVCWYQSWLLIPRAISTSYWGTAIDWKDRRIPRFLLMPRKIPLDVHRRRKTRESLLYIDLLIWSTNMI